MCVSFISFTEMLTFCSFQFIRSIIHADIKPDNILVTADNATVKLADLGTAFYTHELEVGEQLINVYVFCAYLLLPYDDSLICISVFKDHGHAWIAVVPITRGF